MKTLKQRSSSRPSAEEVLRVATEAAPTLPPAQVQGRDKASTLNLRVQESTVEALARTAREQGLTMKQVVVRALAGAGVPVAPLDLEDRTPRRGRPRGV